MVPSPEAYAASMLKGTDLGSPSSGPWIFFNSCVYHSCRISSMYRYITNIAQHLILLLTSFSALASLSSCTGSKNVQVMGFDPSTFLLLHIIQCYKQVNTKNIREERKIVSYPPLGPVDVTVCPIVVHRHHALLFQPVLLWYGSKLHGHPPLAHRIPSLWIFDYPINLPLKLLLLSQVDVLCLAWLYQLLHHLQGVQQMLL
jgi:hypothetical protein